MYINDSANLLDTVDNITMIKNAYGRWRTVGSNKGITSFVSDDSEVILERLFDVTNKDTRNIDKNNNKITIKDLQSGDFIYCALSNKVGSEMQRFRIIKNERDILGLDQNNMVLEISNTCNTEDIISSSSILKLVRPTKKKHYLWEHIDECQLIYEKEVELTLSEIEDKLNIGKIKIVEYKKEEESHIDSHYNEIIDYFNSLYNQEVADLWESLKSCMRNFRLSAPYFEMLYIIMIQVCSKFDLYYSESLIEETRFNYGEGIFPINRYLGILDSGQYNKKTYKDSIS